MLIAILALNLQAVVDDLVAVVAVTEEEVEAEAVADEVVMAVAEAAVMEEEAAMMDKHMMMTACLCQMNY